jgi:hypothetical protein
MSTPINQIRSAAMQQQTPLDLPQQMPIYNPNIDLGPAPQQSNSQLVDDILKEMDVPPGDGYIADMNTGNINYAMDPSAHIPPTRIPGIESMIKAGEPTKSPSLASMIPETQLHFETLPGHESLFTRILHELKPVVIVFIIVVIISIQQTNRALFGFFPSLILENGELSIYAILLRAAIGAVIFYLANKFIPYG